MSEFSAEQKQKALDLLQEFEAQYLSEPTHGFNNPFRRGGVIAADIAYRCDLLKPETTASGRQRVDAPAARRLLKQLIAEGLVESVGAQRTLSAGSRPKDCFALTGFHDRLAEAQAAWAAKAARK